MERWLTWQWLAWLERAQLSRASGQFGPYWLSGLLSSSPWRVRQPRDVFEALAEIGRDHEFFVSAGLIEEA